LTTNVTTFLCINFHSQSCQYFCHFKRHIYKLHNNVDHKNFTGKRFMEKGSGSMFLCPRATGETKSRPLNAVLMRGQHRRKVRA
jgi:hypothetical protein